MPSLPLRETKRGWDDGINVDVVGGGGGGGKRVGVCGPGGGWGGGFGEKG